MNDQFGEGSPVHFRRRCNSRRGEEGEWGCNEGYEVGERCGPFINYGLEV